MNTKLKEILERAETWPDEVQQAADALLSIEQASSEGYLLTEADREALAKSAEDVRQGRFAPDAQVLEFFSRFRRE
jgi:hypothetical protein